MYALQLIKTNKRIFPKVLCSRGAVAKVRIEWFNHNKYTGLFKKADYGLIRLTSAFLGGNSIPSWLGSVSSSKIFPCCALKFFRNSQPHPHCTVQESRNDMGHSGNFLFGGKKTGQMVSHTFTQLSCVELSCWNCSSMRGDSACLHMDVTGRWLLCAPSMHSSHRENKLCPLLDSDVFSSVHGIRHPAGTFHFGYRARSPHHKYN